MKLALAAVGSRFGWGQIGGHYCRSEFGDGDIHVHLGELVALRNEFREKYWKVSSQRGDCSPLHSARPHCRALACLLGTTRESRRKEVRIRHKR